ncbi:9303_t:CDS:1, partial [Cetraspora pellucida]
MGNSKSELDLLKQENARLMARIKELEQITKEKDELEVRIAELEQITKLSQTENAKLKVEIAELNRSVKNIEKQNQTVTNDLKSPEHSISLPSKNCENAQITDKSETRDFVSSSSHQEATSEQIDNTISDIYYLNGTCFGESESLEEKTKTSSLHNAKTMTKCHDQNHTIDNFDTTSEMLESDNQIIEGLIQEITSNQTQSIVLPEINTNNGKIEIIKSCIQDMILDSVQSLSDLFDKAIKSGQKQILCWYYYSLEFENKIKSLTADGKIKYKTARSKIYKEMKPFLPNITDVNLRKKTERARKILKLFGKGGVGIDKINYITYGASTISGLKDTQIQHIINQMASKTVTKCHDQNNYEVSESAYLDNLPKAEISAKSSSEAQ